VILSCRWLLELLARHAAHVERIVQGPEIASAAVVALVGLLWLSGELA
jgi:hypothetical protein